MAVMVVMKVMVVMAVMAVVTASDSIDVGVVKAGPGDGNGEVMFNAALLNVSGGGSGANRDSRVSTLCYTCSGSSCLSLKTCTMSDPVCVSGFESSSGTHLEGCASRSVCDRYAKAYACDVYNSEAYAGYCCCSTNLCNMDISACKAEILYKCRNGAVTVAGRLGGLTAMIALLLPLLLA